MLVPLDIPDFIAKYQEIIAQNLLQAIKRIQESKSRKSLKGLSHLKLFLGPSCYSTIEKIRFAEKTPQDYEYEKDCLQSYRDFASNYFKENLQLKHIFQQFFEPKSINNFIEGIIIYYRTQDKIIPNEKIEEIFERAYQVSTGRNQLLQELYQYWLDPHYIKFFEMKKIDDHFLVCDWEILSLTLKYLNCNSEVQKKLKNLLLNYSSIQENSSISDIYENNLITTIKKICLNSDNNLKLRRERVCIQYLISCLKRAVKNHNDEHIFSKKEGVKQAVLYLAEDRHSRNLFNLLNEYSKELSFHDLREISTRRQSLGTNPIVKKVRLRGDRDSNRAYFIDCLMTNEKFNNVIFIDDTNENKEVARIESTNDIFYFKAQGDRIFLNLEDNDLNFDNYYFNNDGGEMYLVANIESKNMTTIYTLSDEFWFEGTVHTPMPLQWGGKSTLFLTKNSLLYSEKHINMHIENNAEFFGKIYSNDYSQFRIDGSLDISQNTTYIKSKSEIKFFVSTFDYMYGKIEAKKIYMNDSLISLDDKASLKTKLKSINSTLLKNPKFLRELGVPYSSMSYIEKIQDIFSRWKSISNFGLRNLSLTNVGLDRKSIRFISSFIIAYPYLETLHLDDNPLGGKYGRSSWKIPNQTSGIEILFSGLKGYQNLRELSIKKVGLDLYDSKAIQNTLDSLSHLNNFEFTNDEIKDDSLTCSAENAIARAELLENRDAQYKKLFIKTKISNEIQLYELTKKLVELFVPGTDRQHYLEKAQKNDLSLNDFEGLQWRSLHAYQQLNNINAYATELEFIATTVREIWEYFITGYKFNRSILSTEYKLETLNNLHDFIISDLLNDWLMVCKIAEKKFMPETTLRKQTLCKKSESEDFFMAKFRWKLGALFSASSLSESQLVNMNKVTKREQVIQHLKEAGYSALLAIPAIGELSHVVFHGAKALHALGNLKFLSEIAHTIDFTHALAECAGDILNFHSSKPEHLFETVTDKSMFNTEKLLECVYKSFGDLNDFNTKIDGSVKKLIHHFSYQLQLLDPIMATKLGEACANHVALALMFGLLRGYPILSPQEFVSQVFRWVAYIPMESSPQLKLKTGLNISADILLRGAGLKGQFDDKTVFFYWSETNIKVSRTYKSCLWNTLFRYKVHYQQVGYRLADTDEVNTLNKQLLSINKEYISNPFSNALGQQITTLPCVVDPIILTELRIQNIKEVTAVTNTWKPNAEIISNLENEVADLKNKIDFLVKKISFKNKNERRLIMHSQNINALFQSRKNIRKKKYQHARNHSFLENRASL